MIRRYFATKDNTITNAFEENLVTRGTGSNMGASDILEVFSIYGQDSGSSGLSSEKARTLIEFDVPDIKADRLAGLLPASGSVTWQLKMFNAPHSQTVPSSFTLQVKGVSGSWEETSASLNGLAYVPKGFTQRDIVRWLLSAYVHFYANPRKVGELVSTIREWSDMKRLGKGIQQISSHFVVL